MMARRERHFAAGDGADAGLAAGLGVLDQPGQAVVVGEGERGVAQLGGAPDQLGGAGGAVEAAIGAVAVQLRPGCVHDSLSSLAPAQVLP
jgi:hypothetical protein